MTIAAAARLLAEEHPDIAFSANQLRRMARTRTIPALEVPACGVQRKSYHMVNYNKLVNYLLTFSKATITL